MLVLTRKVGEQIVVGGEIVLVINRISGNRVSIGIDAPEHVRVLRGELPLAGPFDADPEPDHRGPEERISPGSKALVSACD